MVISLNSSLSLQSSFYETNINAPLLKSRVKTPKSFHIVAQKRGSKLVKVVLSEDVEKIGKKGELVAVKAGYYRNFLGPRLEAQMATPQFLKELKLEEERKEAEKKRVKEEAQTWARLLEAAGPLKIKRKGGKGKLIFGSVTAQDVADVIKAQLEKEIDKRLITVPDIREVGLFVTQIKLHSEVTAFVRIFVSTT